MFDFIKTIKENIINNEKDTDLLKTKFALWVMFTFFLSSITLILLLFIYHYPQNKIINIFFYTFKILFSAYIGLPVLLVYFLIVACIKHIKK